MQVTRAMGIVTRKEKELKAGEKEKEKEKETRGRETKRAMNQTQNHWQVKWCPFQSDDFTGFI